MQVCVNARGIGCDDALNYSLHVPRLTIAQYKTQAIFYIRV